ncbi:hypothetical protein J2129_002216 [Methanofollis sp. W23]|nr:hypothetical protein [Methanofollis sp. W23]
MTKTTPENPLLSREKSMETMFYSPPPPILIVWSPEAARLRTPRMEIGLGKAE